MKKSGVNKSKIVIGIIIAAAVIAVILVLRMILGIFGYLTFAERSYLAAKTDAALELRYPDHDFDVKAELYFAEVGFGTKLTATDENGIDFWMHWLDDGLEDHYHDRWNETYYGKELVEYQNGLRDRYFADIPYISSYEYYPYETYHFYRGPYKEVFFGSLDEAIEGSRACSFDTDVTFSGIDLDTADDEELEQFAGSIADTMIWLQEETGYYDVKISSFQYRAYDESTGKRTSREELVDRIISKVKLSRKIKKNKDQNK